MRIPGFTLNDDLVVLVLLSALTGDVTLSPVSLNPSLCQKSAAETLQCGRTGLVTSLTSANERCRMTWGTTHFHWSITRMKYLKQQICHHFVLLGYKTWSISYRTLLYMSSSPTTVQRNTQWHHVRRRNWLVISTSWGKSCLTPQHKSTSELVWWNKATNHRKLQSLLHTRKWRPIMKCRSFFPLNSGTNVQRAMWCK